MNNSLFRLAALIIGAVAFIAVIIIFSQLILVQLRATFPVTASQETIGWRAVITVANVLINFILYGILGLFFGYIQPEIKWKWGLWLTALPVLFGVAMLIFVGIEYPIILTFGILAGVVGSSLGARFGSYLAKDSRINISF